MCIRDRHNSTPSSAQSLIELARLVGMTERWNMEAKQQDKTELVSKAYACLLYTSRCV